MTCNNCIHQAVCFDRCRGCGEKTELRKHFADKSEWAHLPSKIGEQVFSIILSGGVPTIMDDRVAGFIIMNDTISVITNWYLDGGEWGYNIFPTEEKAEKACDKYRKNSNRGKN